MASLTESSLVNKFYNSNNNNSNNSNPNENNWYDCVYYCIQTNDKLIKNKFVCYKYKNLKEADTYSKNIKYNFNLNNSNTVLIPMCKWIPDIFHPYFLNKKLLTLFWSNDIKIMHNKRDIK